MTSAEIASLLRFTNGNVEQVSEILKGLDIKGPLAGPIKKRRRTGNKTEEGSSEDEDSTLRPTTQDKRVLEFLMEYANGSKYEEARIFRASGDTFTILPSQIQFFVSLKDLRIVSSGITSLPPEIGTLRYLERFECEDNRQLTQLPREIGDLTKLEHLYCSRNQLTSLPKEIGKLSQLWLLDCGTNQLTSLPKEIGQLSELNQLMCDDNQLTSLPEEIGDLKQLEELQCTTNLLTKLPETIGELTRLRTLACENNRLTVLPKTIGKMEALQILSLESNRLTSLPAEIGLISPLNTVVAHRNPFYRLPLFLGRDGRIGFGGHSITMYAPQGIRKEEDMIKYLDEQNIKDIYNPDDLMKLMDNLADLDAAANITLREIRALYQKKRKEFREMGWGLHFMNDRKAHLEKDLADLERQLEANMLRGEALEFIQRKQAETVQELPMDEKKKALRKFVFEENNPFSDFYERMPVELVKSVIDFSREDFRSTYVVLERDEDENDLKLVVEVLERDQDKNA